MSIRYTDNVEELNVEQLDGFFVGWPNHPDKKKHFEILSNSYKVWLAFDDDTCVGFINAISDSVYYSFIPLLEVLPEYQGQGIGAELVDRMMHSLKNMYAIDIICDDNVAKFYEKRGLVKCNAMIKRNYENQ